MNVPWLLFCIAGAAPDSIPPPATCAPPLYAHASSGTASAREEAAILPTTVSNSGLPVLGRDPGPAAVDDPRAIARPHRHPMILDYMAVSMAMGATYGVARGYCQEKALDPTPILTFPIVVALLSVFSEEYSPYILNHPPDPVGSFAQLNHPHYRTSVMEVQTVDGTWTLGRLAKSTPSTVVLRTRHGARSIPHDSIAVIDIPDDRSSWWGGGVAGAICGALFGLIVANNASEPGDPIQEISSERMALWGAAIVGGTGLALDLLHHGRSRIYGDSPVAMPPRISVGPSRSTAGNGVALIVRF